MLWKNRRRGSLWSYKQSGERDRQPLNAGVAEDELYSLQPLALIKYPTLRTL
jgi:hypothetical protein